MTETNGIFDDERQALDAEGRQLAAMLVDGNSTAITAPRAKIIGSLTHDEVKRMLVDVEFRKAEYAKRGISQKWLSTQRLHLMDNVMEQLGCSVWSEASKRCDIVEAIDYDETVDMDDVRAIKCLCESARPRRFRYVFEDVATHERLAHGVYDSIGTQCVRLFGDQRFNDIIGLFEVGGDKERRGLRALRVGAYSQHTLVEELADGTRELTKRDAHELAYDLISPLTPKLLAFLKLRGALDGDLVEVVWEDSALEMAATKAELRRQRERAAGVRALTPCRFLFLVHKLVCWHNVAGNLPDTDRVALLTRQDWANLSQVLDSVLPWCDEHLRFANGWLEYHRDPISGVSA